MIPHSGCIVRKPQTSTAVAILRTDGALDDARLSDALAANGVGVVCVPMGIDIATALSVAMTEFDPSLPRLIAASGAAVPEARRAARAAGLAGAVLLNVPVGRSAGRRSMPTMVFADRQMMKARMWGRLTTRLSNASFHVVDASLEKPLRSWLSDPTAVVRDPLADLKTARRMVAAAALVASPLVAISSAASASAAPKAAHAAAHAHTAADPFAGGVSVSSKQIKGDGSGVTSASKRDKDGAAHGSVVPASAILGDGTRLVAPAATGSIGLIDHDKLKFFVNTNITFQTTSSASAAASEAEFTTAVPATTLNGGTTQSTLNDAFDGYNSLFVDQPGTHRATTSGHTNTYLQTGAPATADPNCINPVGGTSAQYVFPTKSMPITYNGVNPVPPDPVAVDVSREVYVPEDGSFARWLNKVTNPGTVPVTVAVGTGNNLGSDNNTKIVTSSNGDAISDLTDTWVDTMQNYSGTTSSDVRLAHVLQGPNAPLPLTSNNFVNGDDNPFWSWDVTIQPGETVTFMNFVAGDYTNARAQATAVGLAALTPDSDGVVKGLRCMDAATLSSIQNFALPDVSVAPVTVNEAAGTATVTFTRSASGAPATATFSVTPGTATLGADYSNPSSMTVDFAAGETSKTVSVPILDDSIPEHNETVQIAVTAVTGFGKVAATPSAASAALTIVSDDPFAIDDYVSFQPTRLADSRPGQLTNDGLNAGTGELAAGSTLQLVVAGRGGVTADAKAATLDIAVADPEAAGFVTAYPCGSTMPTASSLNFAAGQTVANAVIAGIGDGGKVCIFTSQPTQLVVDVDGFFPTTTSLHTVMPARLLESRDANTTVDGLQNGGGVLPLGTVTSVQVTGRAGVPANATAAVINVTVTEPQGAGFVTVFPCGSTMPTASNINFAAGQTIANLAISKIGTDGKVCVFNSQPTQLVVDVNAYFPVKTAYSAIVPARLMETRPGLTTIDGVNNGAGVQALGTVTTLHVIGRGGVPANATSVVLNVLVTDPQGSGFVTVYPCGSPTPLASNLNFVSGQTVANAVLAKVGDGGNVCIFNSQATNLVVDVAGYLGS